MLPKVSLPRVREYVIGPSPEPGKLNPLLPTPNTDMSIEQCINNILMIYVSIISSAPKTLHDARYRR
jgi:hypothetical protein